MHEFPIRNSEYLDSEEHYATGEPARILFIRPSAKYMSLTFPDGPRVGTPLGLLYLAGLFKEGTGIETRILDALAYADLENLRTQIAPYYFGMRVEEIVERAIDFKPTIIALSSNFGYFVDNAVETINALREKLPDSFIVAGGADVTAQPAAYLRSAYGLDAVAIGEGEIIFKNLVGRLRNRMNWKDIPGLAFIDNGCLVENPAQAKIKNLDSYDIDYSKIDLDHYFRLYEKGFPARISFEYPGSHRAVSMVTSRGCPFKCVFCSIHLHMGYTFRWHSAENVVNHVKHLVERYDVRHFHFEDDNLTLYQSRFKGILEGIIANRLNITWDTPNGVRADMLTRELIQLAKQSGCVYLMFGVESGSQAVLDRIVKKNLDLRKVVHSAQMCHEIGLDTGAFYILGFPGETKRDIQKTYDLAFELFRRYKTRPHVNIARPLKGTELYRTAKEKNFLIDTEVMDPEDRYEIPKILIASQMIQTDEFDLVYLTHIFRKYRSALLRQGIINLLETALRIPWTFSRIIGVMMLDILRNPARARTILYRYCIRKFIFPHALVRESILGSGRKPVVGENLVLATKKAANPADRADGNR